MSASNFLLVKMARDLPWDLQGRVEGAGGARSEGEEELLLSSGPESPSEHQTQGLS